MQGKLNLRYHLMRATEDAPRGPVRLLEHRHGLAEIIERGAGVVVERPRVKLLHRERETITFSENTPRHGHRFAQQRLGFFEALQIAKVHRVVVGYYEGSFVFFAVELQISGVYVSFHL